MRSEKGDSFSVDKKYKDITRIQRKQQKSIIKDADGNSSLTQKKNKTMGRIY